MLDTIAAFRELDNHPDTVFTVLTGEGRFFSAGADVKAVSASSDTPNFANDAEKKVHFMSRFSAGKTREKKDTSRAPSQSSNQTI
jgi:peroxisomal 3,2-trans-enoyl-CoA isomerase